jgi:hypothetical protein
MEILTAAGKNPKIISFIDEFGALFFRTGEGTLFSTTGYHEAVLCEGIVYDALTGAKGMPLADYLAMLEQFGIYPVYIPF